MQRRLVYTASASMPRSTPSPLTPALCMLVPRNKVLQPSLISPVLRQSSWDKLSTGVLPDAWEVEVRGVDGGCFLADLQALSQIQHGQAPGSSSADACIL